MNNEDVLLARAKYNSIKNDQEKLNKLKKQLKKLENSPSVIEYISLKKRCEIASRDELSILYSVFKSTKKDNVYNSIYVYMGTYKEKYADKYRTLLLYKNIEPGYMDIWINLCDRELFEERNTVIKFKNMKNIDLKYYQLQQFYLYELLTNDFVDECQLAVKLYNKVKEI